MSFIDESKIFLLYFYYHFFILIKQVQIPFIKYFRYQFTDLEELHLPESAISSGESMKDKLLSTLKFYFQIF